MISHDGYNNVDQVYDGYMEQEEEWEREGLLDPAWEKQQKKVGILHRHIHTPWTIAIFYKSTQVHSLLFEFSSVDSVKL